MAVSSKPASGTSRSASDRFGGNIADLRRKAPRTSSAAIGSPAWCQPRKSSYGQTVACFGPFRATSLSLHSGQTHPQGKPDGTVEMCRIRPDADRCLVGFRFHDSSCKFMGGLP
jgi:hypothetical protein